MEILIPEFKIERRVRAMAHRISEEHKASGDTMPPVMICVLNGGFAFFSDLVKDILDVNATDIEGEFGMPDVIWASPPCTTFSVSSIGCHWMGGTGAYIPKTDKCRNNIDVVKKSNSIIRYFLHKNPNLLYYIENPRGVLRKLDLMNWTTYRKTIWYCQYGDKRAKPTDIWTNDFNWIPRPVCKNGNPNCHHERAPRGSRTGTQGLKGNYERSIVPSELCKEILKGLI